MRGKKYTARQLEEAVERYFSSISRTVTVKDASGKPVLNDAGEPMRKLEYVTPPSIAALCLFLDIDRKTWSNYGRTKGTDAVVTRTRERIEAYLETELLSRRKGIQGVIFNLQNNYGWRERREVELGEETRKQASLNVSVHEKLRMIAEASAMVGELADDDDEEAEHEAGRGGQAL